MRPKRLISLLVAVCMMITMLPLSAVTAFAADTSTDPEDSYKGYKYAYTVNNGNATITKFLGPDDSVNPVDSASTVSYDIEIPSELNHHPVTAIGEDAFRGCSALKKVTIPQSVTSIGDSAFAGCHNLDSVTIKDAATSIGSRAFTECPLTTTLSLGKNITTIGDHAFYYCLNLKSVTIPQSVTSIGDYAFGECVSLKTLSFGENSFGENIETNIKTIGNYAFNHCNDLESVTIPQSVTSIGREAFRFCNNMKSLAINGAIESMGTGAFAGCISLEKISLGENIKTIGYSAFASCTSINLTNVTIPKNVTTIEPDTFYWCFSLKDITLPAGLTSFQDDLSFCPAGRIRATDVKTDENGKPILNPDGSYIYIYTPDGAIYFNNDRDHADNLLKNPVLAGRNFLCLCHVTFDAKGGDLTYDKVPVYETEKIIGTKANKLKAIPNPTRAGYNFTGWYTDTDGKQLFNADETAITDDITLHAGWEFDPNAPGYRPLTVTGGTVTVKYDGSDVTSKLNSKTDAATGQKTYSVPDGAEVTVTLDKTAVPNGKVFDGWSTSLPAGQDYKAESITFTMRSGVNVSAKYRDAATDHTPDTAVCHPLTVTGGIVTVKNGDKDVTDTLTVTTDETTGKKTYSVPKDATVTVTLDKDKIPEGMVFDIWSTGKFSLPLGQDYKAETITFPMSSDVDIAAQYRDATIEDDGPGVLGTAAIIGTAAVGGAVLGYQAYSLGAEFAGKLMALPYFPSNRSALAMMLWEDAGKPMPESELLYPDVGQEERDMDLQHAARWAMENELIPDLNDEGTAPEEMKFYPDNAVSKLDVLNAWQKAQELKNN